MKILAIVLLPFMAIGFVACTIWAGIYAGWDLGMQFGRYMTKD